MNNKTPTEFDIRLGKKIKFLRIGKGFSRIRVSKRLKELSVNISHQQLAKYENGTNRISVSRLYNLSRVFEISINDFFNEEKSSNADTKGRHRTLNLVNKFLKIKDEAVQQSILTMVHRIAEIE